MYKSYIINKNYNGGEILPPTPIQIGYKENINHKIIKIIFIIIIVILIIYIIILQKEIIEIPKDTKSKEYLEIVENTNSIGNNEGFKGNKNIIKKQIKKSNITKVQKESKLKNNQYETEARIRLKF